MSLCFMSILKTAPSVPFVKYFYNQKHRGSRRYEGHNIPQCHNITHEVIILAQACKAWSVKVMFGRYGRLIRSLICRREILDMFNFLVKNTIDLLFGRRLWSSVGSFLVGRNQKRYNRPVEVCFLNNLTLVTRATIC